MPAWSSAASIERTGKLASFLRRERRSSSTAKVTRPSSMSAADESCRYELIPRTYTQLLPRRPDDDSRDVSPRRAARHAAGDALLFYEINGPRRPRESRTHVAARLHRGRPRDGGRAPRVP